MIVFPTIETWEIKLLFFPISTLSPIIQNGPIDELLSIFALLEIQIPLGLKSKISSMIILHTTI